MSNERKLSLWQRFKRLLTSRAPQAIIDAVNIDSASVPESVLAPNENAKSFDAQSSHSYSNATDKQATKTKVSLLKKANDSDKTAIIDYLKDYIRKRHWYYIHYKPKLSDPHCSHHISLRMQHKKSAYSYLFRVQEDNGLLAVYGILPFLIPESHQSAAMLLITQINYDMIIGNLEMDVNDGELRYKNAIDIDVVGMDDAIIEHLLQSVIAMTTVAHEVFGDLINTQNPSEDMPTLLGELRQQADARTYFLASQKTQ